MVEKRENEIDTLKGIGILFVIASHCDANLRLFFSYPFSFTMPLFFWVAGYFLTNRTSFPVFVGKKFNRLILSYWLWCVLSADVFFIQTRLHNPLAYFPIPAELWRMFLLSSSPLQYSVIMCIKALKPIVRRAFCIGCGTFARTRRPKRPVRRESPVRRFRLR